ncbi:MAG: PQQ-binding-like beta-propeller repeat protein, partial [Actinomycetota bacterium]
MSDSRVAASHRHCLGAAPWPTPDGNPWNGNTSSVSATARGEVRWSVELPGTGVGGMAVVADGRIFLTARGRVMAFHPGGDLLWDVEAQPRGALAALADGRLIVPEGRSGYAVRDQDAGKLLGTAPGGWWLPGLTPEGHFVYTDTGVGRESDIRVSDLSGKLLWSASLVDPSAVYPPLALEGLVIVGDGPYLRAYDPKGAPLWIANHQGFELTDQSNSPERATQSCQPEEDVRAVVWLGGDRLLAGFGAWGVHIFDFAAHTV